MLLLSYSVPVAVVRHPRIATIENVENNRFRIYGTLPRPCDAELGFRKAPKRGLTTMHRALSALSVRFSGRRNDAGVQLRGPLRWCPNSIAAARWLRATCT